MNTYGLIGASLNYSFSQKYFSDKFQNEGLIDNKYLNFELGSIHNFPEILKSNKNICGLNCTIPYKEEIIQYLDEIDSVAKNIGAVNTIKILKYGGVLKLKGYNTDVIGFEKSISPILKDMHKKALILGTGGASKAVVYVLNKLGIEYKLVSRKYQNNSKVISYTNLTKNLIKEHLVIINCTPLGTFPNINACADIPYQYINANHVLYDLIYNPTETLFLQKGAAKGAIIKNGLEMLKLQAEAAWNIWQY